MKYYRDNNGFIYTKSGENTQTVYLDCFNSPNCLAGARFTKQTGVFTQLASHSDEIPSENIVLKIMFEANLKNEVRKVENAEISVLNLYKRAIVISKGIWLPINHKSIFLEKLRRIRKYEKEKGKKVNVRPQIGAKLKPATADATTSPMSSKKLTTATEIHRTPIIATTKSVSARKPTQCNAIYPKLSEITGISPKPSSSTSLKTQIQLRPRMTPQTVVNPVPKTGSNDSKNVSEEK